MRIKSKNWFIYSGILFLIYMGLAEVIRHAGNLIQPMDVKGVSFLFNFGGQQFKPLWMGIAHLGDFSFCLILACAIGLVFAFFKRGTTGMMLVLGLIGVRILTNIFKEWINRPRPELTHALSDGSRSFPSGHLLVTMFFYGFLVFLLTYLLIKNKKRMMIGWLLVGFFLFLMLQSASGLALGAHYPSDLLGGILLGGSWLCFIIALLNLARHRGFR